jgi:hypothetical protein
VAIWRNPALEALFGGPVDETGLTEDAVLRLVAAGARETDELELKRDPYPGAPAGRPLAWTTEQEFAKDVTALANHVGGLLLIGVDEQDGAAAEAVPTVDDPDREVQRLRQALVNHAAPVPRAVFVPVPAAAGGHYLAVVVPPSLLAPHAVTGQRGDSRRPLHWFVRDGAHTRPLAEPDVADRYRARLRGAADRTARRNRAAAEGRDALGRSDDLWLWAATVPEAPVPARLDAAAVRDAARWWQQEYSFVSPLSRWLQASGQPIAGPNRTTFTGPPLRDDDDEADPRVAYIELHADGSAFAATPVELNTGDDGGIGVVTLVDDMTVIADACLSWALRQAGTWGTADVVCGLRDGAALDGQLSRPAELVDYSYGQSRRVRLTRRLHRPPTATTTADLADCDTPQGRLAATSAAAGALLQWFGVPEPPQIAPDGTVRTHEWGDRSRARQVEQWADNRGIPHTDWA